MKSMHKNGFPYKFVQEYKAGVRKSITEWADYFGVTYAFMNVILVNLRKRGMHFHPTSESITVKGVSKIGMVVDIMDKQSYVVPAMDAYENRSLIPHMKGIFSKIEAMVSKYPKLESVAQEMSDNMQARFIESRKVQKRLRLTAPTN